MPHKLEYLFGKNDHSWRVFCSSSITIWFIMAVKYKEGWGRKSSVKNGWEVTEGSTLHHFQGLGLKFTELPISV